MDDGNAIVGVVWGCLFEALVAAGLVLAYLIGHFVWSLLWTLF